MRLLFRPFCWIVQGAAVAQITAVARRQSRLATLLGLAVSTTTRASALNSGDLPTVAVSSQGVTETLPEASVRLVLPVATLPLVAGGTGRLDTITSLNPPVQFTTSTSNWIAWINRVPPGESSWKNIWTPKHGAGQMVVAVAGTVWKKIPAANAVVPNDATARATSAAATRAWTPAIDTSLRLTPVTGKPSRRVQDR